jgi:predicted phage terminase large subunit-like protein
MARRPRVAVIAASHTASLAERNSRKAQDNLRDMSAPLRVGLRTEAVEAWEASNRSEYKASGVGGPITGRRADLGIIDDPVKGPDDVAHDGPREKVWDWYVRTFRTRLKPGAAVVLVMTRWHGDDLGGRLLSLQPDMWDKIVLPAQAVEDDPLGRAPGEWLWGDDSYNYAADLQLALAEAEKNGAMQAWSALYQQNPLPAGGSIFKVEALPDILPAAPLGGSVCRAWDFAATSDTGKNNPDWTVGVKMARMNDGRFVVQDVIRFRGGPDEVRAQLVSTARMDGPSVRISIPQDPGQAGKTQVLDYTRALVGFRVESSPETGDKATRAAPVASQFNVGNVSLVIGDWNKAFISELAAFPNGVKDDQVDALSRAFSVVGLTRGPMQISAEALKRFGVR